MISQLSVRELHERLKDDGAAVQVLDVRENWELKICALAGATHIPMREVPTRLTELNKEKPLVVMCHHGVRSQHVANFLAHQGFSQLYNLSGGIDAWAKEVDPSMAVY